MKPSFELPATFEITVWFKDDEKGQIGKATMSLPAGQYPTQADINNAVEIAKEQLLDSGLEICDHHEFARAWIMEQTGQRMAIPGPNKWAEPYTA